VAFQQSLRVVALAEDVAIDSLAVGDDVLLTHDLNLIVRKLEPSVTRASDVGDFEALLPDGRVMLKTQDLPVIVGVVLIAAVFVVIANIVVDMLYAVLDPRVRLS